MTVSAPGIVIALATAIVATACAPVTPLEDRDQPNMVEVAKVLNCSAGLKATCVARYNKSFKCFCMDDDAVRMLLEPDKYY